MSPLFSSSLAALFVLCAITATFIMLELRGKPKDRALNPLLINLHKIAGWTFTGIFLFLLPIMSIKYAGYNVEVSARIALHIVLSLALLPLLAIKIIIARRYARLASNLIIFGATILVLAFALTGISAGYYFLHSSDTGYVALKQSDQKMLDSTIGQQIVNQKCRKCHSLKRVYSSSKSKEGWTRTINRMAQLDAPHISSFDIKQAINFLSTRQKVQLTKKEIKDQKDKGQSILQSKCTACHSLDRITQASKNKDQWRSTIERMIKHSNDPEYLSRKQKKDLVAYLKDKDSD